jgi:BirA family biotin operon repressor/biotin-[acetyl-CoA-carboxylase] ligase
VGVAMMRVLVKSGANNVGLKWPNDVLAVMPKSDGNILHQSHSKLAGILIEAQGDMLGPSLVVIGVGMNLRLPQTVIKHIDQPSSCLSQIMAEPPERNHLLAMLLQELAEMLTEFAEQGFAPLRAEWESYHVYQNRQVKLLLPDNTEISSVVRGVTDTGALRVETRQGEQVFNAGEISLREA